MSDNNTENEPDQMMVAFWGRMQTSYMTAMKTISGRTDSVQQREDAREWLFWLK